MVEIGWFNIFEAAPDDNYKRFGQRCSSLEEAVGLDDRNIRVGTIHLWFANGQLQCEDFPK